MPFYVYGDLKGPFEIVVKGKIVIRPGPSNFIFRNLCIK